MLKGSQGIGGNRFNLGDDEVGFNLGDQGAQGVAIEHIQHVGFVRHLHGGGIGVAVGGDHFDPEPLQLDGDLLAKFAGAQQQGTGGAGAGCGSKHTISPDVDGHC